MCVVNKSALILDVIATQLYGSSVLEISILHLLFIVSYIQPKRISVRVFLNIRIYSEFFYMIYVGKFTRSNISYLNNLDELFLWTMVLLFIQIKNYLQL